MFGVRLKALREQRGLTQGQLAESAGVSRQLVGAVEAGRHLPRVDAAARLAAAVGAAVESLLGPPAERLEDVTGGPVPRGVPLRVACVGDRLMCAPAGAAGEGWELADALLGDDGLELLPGASPGAVVVGCDPALGLLERIVARRDGPRLMAVSAPTTDAVDALDGGRVQAAVVHGPHGGLPIPAVPTRRWELARWRVGLAAAPDAPGGWWREALAGRRRVAQRRPGAASQRAFEAAAGGGGRVPGPVADGHVDAARYAARDGLVAVTIEPVAIATGLAFHALEEHVAQLWVADAHQGDPGVAALGEALVSAAFRRRVEAVGGYDLTALGHPIAA